ncbi:putative quinol monooxygenase [Rubrobacter indicoceani]|uniref:putative quinol monooxygenase n=1 Tax=Rubrobacter indicoceani TaxID=2051957 RepID=UPI000E5BCA43|nr:putative quinol monooxygenase [Rubrobacter indicoceani]
MTKYGLIGRMLAAPGKRDELIDVLLGGVSGMPGCLSYVVARDSEDPDALWVSEVWESKEAHETSLSLPPVQEAISKGRPMIAGFGERFETEPVGGHGLTTGS